ncbi:hypothetical protein HA402_010421 [Bradysia odoriphaga]|nr:hypothetical protein HA402_010421 [Bradysia odoriphaga]
MYATKYDAENKLWTGNDYTPLFHPKISLGQVMQRFMKVNGSKLAQICDDTGEQMDYDEMWLKTVRAAQNLRKLGYSKGDVFSYSVMDRHVAPVIYAAFCLGCPVNTISPFFGKSDMIHVLRITKPKLMFCDVERYHFVSDCLLEAELDAKIITFGGSTMHSYPVENLFVGTGMEHTFLPTTVDGAKDVAALVCSSGTTGLCKIVALSHSNIVEGCGNITSLNAGDIHYCPGLFNWVSGLYIFVLGVIHGATSVVTKNPLSPDLQIRLVEKHRISFLMNSPHHLVMMLKSEAIKTADLSSIKCYFVGGNRMPLGAPAEINKRLPNGQLITAYGQTELSFLVSGTFERIVEEDHVGKLAKGVIVKIVDEKGARCGVGIDGEICVKTCNPFLCYYGNEEATKNAFDNEGFILTGDVGRFDENGDLHIVDRLKEIFKSNNFNINPSEIESFLIQSPDIESVCVLGIPDALVGDWPAAAVVRKKNSTITERDIYDMVAIILAFHRRSEEVQ